MIKIRRQVIRIGENSKGIVIPAALADAFEIDKGDEVVVEIHTIIKRGGSINNV